MKKKGLILAGAVILLMLAGGCGKSEAVTPDAVTEENANASELPETEEDSMIQEETAAEELSAVEEAVKNSQVGDVIEVGSFEQDGDEANGAEPIEWQVLADEDGKKLLLSRYILMPLGNIMYDEFPGDGVNYTWAECGIRSYLNGEFYESAFTDEEKELIAETSIRTTWRDDCSLGAELVDVETISYESFGTEFSYDVGKMITTDKIFIPDFDEDLAKYLKVEKGDWWMYGTDLLAKATPASGVQENPYDQSCFDEAKELCSEDVNLDESLIGENFGDYIMRNGGSFGVTDMNGESIKTTAFYVVSGECGGSFSPYWLTELTDRTDVGIRPMMWVNVE